MVHSPPKMVAQLNYYRQILTYSCFILLPGIQKPVYKKLRSKNINEANLASTVYHKTQAQPPRIKAERLAGEENKACSLSAKTSSTESLARKAASGLAPQIGPHLGITEDLITPVYHQAFGYWKVHCSSMCNEGLIQCIRLDCPQMCASLEEHLFTFHARFEALFTVQLLCSPPHLSSLHV